MIVLRARAKSAKAQSASRHIPNQGQTMNVAGGLTAVGESHPA